jgi:cytochrome c2
MQLKWSRLNRKRTDLVFAALSVIACTLAASLYAAPPANRIPLSRIAADRTNGTVTVLVEDPVYQKKKQYEGYSLKAVMEKYFDTSARQEPGEEIIFHTRDGYNPSMPVSDAISGRGVIAIRDLEAHGGNNWIPFVSNGKSSTPGEFYLVWTGEAKLAQRFPWPYQIESIELVRASVFQNAEPTSASASVKKGYESFRHTCLKCHSINFVGGTMGGELNVPLNVTEYWKPKELIAFISNPQSVRATSKMPKLGISSEDAFAVSKYLEAMAKQKVCNNEAECSSRRPKP